MPLSVNQEAFFSLVRSGLGYSGEKLPVNVDWMEIETLARQQGLPGIVLDGIEKLPKEERPSKPVLLHWIGQMLQEEKQHAVQQKTAAEMASLFNRHGINTFVLKGAVVAECYPNPLRRMSVDVDCFLLPQEGNDCVWEKGNRLIEEAGYEVGRSYYKNSTFHLPGLFVENHRFITPFRGNKKLRQFEKLLQDLMLADKGKSRFEGSFLYRPPIMVTALFLIEHAYSHFLHEGLNWKHILDWMMFRERHEGEVEWGAFDAYVNDFGFREFYDSYHRLGLYLLDKLAEDKLTMKDRMMMEDVWAPLDLHETLYGLKGKLALVGNTWRARWKYGYFTDISWLRALWIQVKGFLFVSSPKL